MRKEKLGSDKAKSKSKEINETIVEEGIFDLLVNFTEAKIYYDKTPSLEEGKSNNNHLKVLNVGKF